MVLVSVGAGAVGNHCTYRVGDDRDFLLTLW